MSAINFQVTKELNGMYANCERVLDVAGYIPFVSIGSACVRSGLALVQAVHGLSLVVFAFAAHVTYTSINKKSPAEKILQEAGYLFVNSFFNVLRAKVEAVPFFGGLTCLAFDILKSGLSKNQLGFVYGNTLSDVKLHSPLIARVLAEVDSSLREVLL